jgi:hypothetical protein
MLGELFRIHGGECPRFISCCYMNEAQCRHCNVNVLRGPLMSVIFSLIELSA